MSISFVMGANNPAYLYCTELGYEYQTEKTDLGEIGYCVIKGEQYDAWEFFRGEVATDFSYCAREGYNMKVEKMNNEFSKTTVYCTKDGEDFVQTERMGISSSDEEPRDNSEENGIFTDFVSNYVPTDFDWRDVSGDSYIGPVRDQGACGSCYSFGVAAAAEGTYNYAKGKKNANTIDFSEAHIAWCLGSMEEYKNEFYGCDGASYAYAELTAAVEEGLILESDYEYPYDYFNHPYNTNFACEKWDEKPVIKFDRWKRVEPENIEAIKTAIMKYGVIDAAVLVTDDYYTYTGGVYTDNYGACTGGAYSVSNHAIALVGWGNDPIHGDYFILRNSWGPSWGENGYMKIAVNASGVSCAATSLRYKLGEQDSKNMKLNIRMDNEILESDDTLRTGFDISDAWVDKVRVSVVIPELGFSTVRHFNDASDNELDNIELDIYNAYPGEYLARYVVSSGDIREVKHRYITIN